MPLSRSVHMYHDVQAILSSAREAGGAIFRLDTPGKATAWRQRAYYYRKLLAKADEERHQGVPGYFGSTEWDDVVLTIEPEDPTGVRIQFGVVRGKLEGLDGGNLEVAKGKPTKKKLTAPADADLLAAAESLAMEIDKS